MELESVKMSSLDSLRTQFLQLLEEIEKIAASKNDSETAGVNQDNYESCVKIDGHPILPPVMTPEKRQKCSEWKKEALEVEAKIAKKKQEKFKAARQAVPETRERRLSYTLDEPSPVLLAYMQRFGQEAKEEQPEKPCENPQCVLENYLSNLSKAPEVSAIGKENVPPPAAEKEWQDDAAQNPLKTPDDTPTWARSPKSNKQEKEPPEPEVQEESTLMSSLTITEPTQSLTSAKDTTETEVADDSTIMNSMTITEPPTTTTTTTNREMIEKAIADLAQEQQKEIDRLLEQQAKDREQLRAMFEEQQKALVAKVMGTMSSTASSSATVTTQRSKSPVIPTVKVKVEPSSLQLPKNYELPDAAQTPEYTVRFDKLSALIKGHLTRRLLKTEKVQNIVRSMRDIMNIALQLHQEGTAAPRAEDVQLHARLLHQLQKESHSFHDVFFKYNTEQKMSIIRHDLEHKENSPPIGTKKPRRISAVTLAKLQRKEAVNRPALKSQSANSMTKTKRLLNSPKPKILRVSAQLSPAKVKSRRTTGVKQIVHAKPWK